MKKKIRLFNLSALLFLFILSSNAQTSIDSKCIESYWSQIRSIKSNEGKYDDTVNKLYNLYYYNITSTVPNESTNFFVDYNKFQIDENSGLIFLIQEFKPESWSNTYTYYLRIMHPIIGPLQFYFDESNGNLFLPNQNKKVSLTSTSYSQDYGFKLVVETNKSNGVTTTEIEDKYNRCCNQPSIAFLYDKEKELFNFTNYPPESNFYSFYGTHQILDDKKSTSSENKYYPSYQEKLAIYRTGGLPRQDLENPNFYISKTEDNAVYKKEVYGRKGTRHFLNDCYEELEATFLNYLIYKQNDKYGIIDVTSENLKSGNHVLTKNIYDKLEWKKGTEYFIATINDRVFTIDSNGNEIIPASDIPEYTKETKFRISETDTIEQEKKTIITNSVSNAEFVKDIDGNNYKIVKIGNKLWMSDNLKVTRFNNGVELLNIKNKSKWSNINKPAWCMYDNSEIYHNITGKIYNGYVVRNYMQICPTDWHIPDEQDWNELISFFGSSEQASINLRSKKGWKQLNGSNSSGMMILPGGVRNLEGNFLGAGNLNVFWSSSPDQTGEKIQIRTMDSQKHGLNKKTSSFNNGYYIRCVRN
jgi:uncharacterized protein (TIGR02145 family)